MVSLRKRTIGKKHYYYLEHSFKIGRKVKKEELYLGTELPNNIEKIKREFLNKIYRKKWFDKLDAIKKKFQNEFGNMPGLAKEKYIENFMVKFTYDSNRIEGSTITLKETARLLEEGIVPKNRPLKDVKETESHKKVFYEMLKHKKDISMNMVLHLHKLLFKESEPEIAGKVRNHEVAVAGSKSKFPIPAELDFLLEEFFKWYNNNKKKTHPVELAALVHLKFVSIHPFTDGNGRISRLLMNFVMNKNGFPMLDIKYSNRSDYYTALERSQVKGIEIIFMQHIIRRYIKEYAKYLK